MSTPTVETASVIQDKLQATDGAITIENLCLDHHWEDVKQLLETEEWPFIKEDLEVSHAQDKAFGLIAKRYGKISGFFTVHNFGDTAYLDMMIVEKAERNSVAMAAELWRHASAEAMNRGFTTKVAHCTNDSAPLLRLFGFKKTMNFTLLRREATTGQKNQTEITYLDSSALTDLVDLDEEVFSARRESWISNLLEQKTTRFVGTYKDNRLMASICLRTRRDNSLCIDSANSLDFRFLTNLLESVISNFSHKRLECFVKTDGVLHEYLLANGFTVPDFFKPIGPLDELRHGDENQIGTGQHVHTLSWI